MQIDVNSNRKMQKERKLLYMSKSNTLEPIITKEDCGAFASLLLHSEAASKALLCEEWLEALLKRVRIHLLQADQVGVVA